MIGNRLLLCETDLDDYIEKQKKEKKAERKEGTDFEYQGSFVKEIAATDKLIDPSKYVETGL